MVQVSGREAFTDSTLVRLLARLTGDAVRHADRVDRGTAEPLSEWLRWTDAIALSTALNGKPAATRTAATAAHSQRIDSALVADADRARVRQDLAQAITQDALFDATDFAPWRQRLLARQQAMASGIGTLRDRVRVLLAARSGDMARLAAVDAVMAHALEAQQQALLATIPSLLADHFKRLRLADEASSDAWLAAFRADLRDVLLAELDVRLQPVEGLIEALRASKAP